MIFAIEANLLFALIKLVYAKYLDNDSEFGGLYFNTELALLFKFEVGDDALYTKSMRHENLRLNYIGPGNYIGQEVIRSLAFARDPRGRITGFSLVLSR